MNTPWMFNPNKVNNKLHSLTLFNKLWEPSKKNIHFKLKNDTVVLN